MDLNSLIPHSGDWKVSKNRVFVRNIAWLPVFDIESENLIHIFLDFRNCRHILKLLKNVKTQKVDCLFLSPLFADPGYDASDFHSINIKNYLKNFANGDFFDGLEKIQFDLIENLIEYCQIYDCTDLIKDVYQSVNVDVQKNFWDYYSAKWIYSNNRQDIRERFNTLYRDIQLQQILKS
jgi:hypothetical protein